MRGRRTPKALQPVKLNQMRKPQKKASIADRKLDPTRNVWSLFFLVSSSAHFDFGPQNKLLILFASQGKKNVNYPLCLNRPTHTHTPTTSYDAHTRKKYEKTKGQIEKNKRDFVLFEAIKIIILMSTLSWPG